VGLPIHVVEVASTLTIPIHAAHPVSHPPAENALVPYYVTRATVVLGSSEMILTYLMPP
jgi:hypothetical protein